MRIPYRNTIQFWLLALMPAGILFSRILLSCSVIGFITLACLHPDIIRQCRRLLKDPLLLSITLLFIVPLVSGLWSDDLQNWLGVLKIKLPLLLMPLAFAGDFRMTPKQNRTLAFIFLFMVLAGSLQSLYAYIGQIAVINDAYFRSQVMPTPIYGDHIRFSWMVSLAVMVAGWLSADRWKEQKWISYIMVISGGWLIVYLHLLAARTGLIALYGMLFITAFWFLFRMRKPLVAVVLSVVLLALPVIAYQTLPSFHNRVRIVIFEYDYFKHLDYLPGSNDAVRVISFRAGWELMQAKAFTGSGFGDVEADARSWYTQQYPQMREADKKTPGSEWILYGAAAGWPGLLLFGLVMAVPFFVRNRSPWLWCSLHLTAILCFLTDIGLEVQAGVTLYVFMYAWWRLWLVQKNNTSLQAV